MLSHSAIWDAIDSLASRHGFSTSALARMAGLDPTTFNKSKRISPDGRERWPSTESLAKVLDITGETFDGFLSAGSYYTPPPPSPALPGVMVPLLGFAQAGAGGYFDGAGFPAGQGWDEVKLPTGQESGLYALEVSGDSMLPLYRDGDRIVVSPTEQVRRGDRVVARTTNGEVMVKILARQSARQVELHSLNPDHPPRILDMQDVEWLARIIWASQ